MNIVVVFLALSPGLQIQSRVLKLKIESTPANTMWRKLLYSGFETCFGPSTQGAGTETHLKSRFCAILQKKGSLLPFTGNYSFLKLFSLLPFVGSGCMPRMDAVLVATDAAGASINAYITMRLLHCVYYNTYTTLQFVYYNYKNHFNDSLTWN